MQKTIVARDEFFLNVRTAVTLLLPIVDETHPYTRAEGTWKALRRSNNWPRKNQCKGINLATSEDRPERPARSLDRNAVLSGKSWPKIGPI